MLAAAAASLTDGDFLWDASKPAAALQSTATMKVTVSSTTEDDSVLASNVCLFTFNGRIRVSVRKLEDPPSACQHHKLYGVKVNKAASVSVPCSSAHPNNL